MLPIRIVNKKEVVTAEAGAGVDPLRQEFPKVRRVIFRSNRLTRRQWLAKRQAMLRLLAPEQDNQVRPTMYNPSST